MAEPFSITAFFVSLALSGAQYAANRFLTPKQPPIQRGKLEGELNIQNSQSGAFIPEIYGGDVSAIIAQTAPSRIYLDADGNVAVSKDNAITVLGSSFAWHDAADISWAVNGDLLDSVYNVSFHASNNLNQNPTKYWPGKGRYFKRLTGDIEAGSRYFLSPEIIEPLPDSFPCFKTGQVNSKPAVSFDGNGAYAGNLAPFDVAGTTTIPSPASTGEMPHVFSGTSYVTVFLVGRLSSFASGNACFYTLSSQGVHNLSVNDRERISLSYFADLDCFGWSNNWPNGDCYGVANASSWIKDWFVLTAICNPVESSVLTRRLRVNGVELGATHQRLPSSGEKLFNMTQPRALLYGVSSTVQNDSLDTYNASSPSPNYSRQKPLFGDLANVITIHTTSSISDADLEKTESVLMELYGINA